MDKLSNRKSAVLEVLDIQIEELEEKLRKAQPFIDELAQLRRTRATLLNERTTTGGISRRTQLTMETVIQAMRDNDNDPLTPQELAEKTGVDVTIVRSHLNRHNETRYRKEGDGWVLIGEDDEEDDE